jgi:hypothetical protein
MATCVALMSSKGIGVQARMSGHPRQNGLPKASDGKTSIVSSLPASAVSPLSEGERRRYG